MFGEKKYYPMNGFRVCVDTAENDIIGVAYSPLESGSINYKGFNDLLLKMDSIFDRSGYPQSFQEKRSFRSEKKTQQPYKGIPSNNQRTAEIFDKHGVLATFDVIITSRRNTSWQGKVYAENGELAGNFDGEIELLDFLLSEKK